MALLLFIGISYYSQITSLLEHEKFHLMVNVPCYGEADLNYFVFEMKDGTSHDSRDKLFYFVVQKNYIRLLFIDGNYLIINKKELKFLILSGLPIPRLWKKESLDVLIRCKYSEYLPMTLKIPGDWL